MILASFLIFQIFGNFRFIFEENYFVSYTKSFLDFGTEPSQFIL